MQQYTKAQCPYCGEPLELVIDPSVAEQDYIEDCEVCCRPLRVLVSGAGGQSLRVEVRREDE
ncbi:CPXCG motif-containing cysteine-rich protein [Thiohalomonas denitrificans]|uniref:Cysteine-rich CPXCG n=1 Tax=Thiohalomonas denitrificans TaxID=415747 RepID=A0A1G5QV06_9GAMM|nr:CPXCG motif-containing cysteine-rich protein [Thiohalomonas denitrificans]SCZ64909.1 Cysteine-rich CPXCG [Thiohalomonas denitrificans]